MPWIPRPTNSVARWDYEDPTTRKCLLVNEISHGGINHYDVYLTDLFGDGSKDIGESLSREKAIALAKKYMRNNPKG